MADNGRRGGGARKRSVAYQYFSPKPAPEVGGSQGRKVSVCAKRGDDGDGAAQAGAIRKHTPELLTPLGNHGYGARGMGLRGGLRCQQ